MIRKKAGRITLLGNRLAAKKFGVPCGTTAEAQITQSKKYAEGIHMRLWHLISVMRRFMPPNPGGEDLNPETIAKERICPCPLVLHDERLRFLFPNRGSLGYQVVLAALARIGVQAVDNGIGCIPRT